MAAHRRGGEADDGFTLVELLLTISILGVGVVTVLGGMMTSIKSSDIERRTADAQGAVRAMAEAVAGDTYQDCATTYPATGFAAPSGFTATLAVTYWDTTLGSFSSTCPGTDSGLQRVTLTVTASDARATEVLRTAKRRHPAGEP